MENKEELLVDVSLEELESRKEELIKLTEQLSKDLQERTFPIEIESKGFLNNLIKSVEKNYKWKHNEIMGYVMLCNNLKDEKKREDLEKTMNLRTANVATFYKTLVEFTGQGIHEAKEHLRNLTVVGESVSNAMKSIEEENQKIRDAYTELNEIETKLLANKEGLKLV